jgi:pSer/pThr/pTyr-binding forkhead associated (FHA) protein
MTINDSSVSRRHAEIQRYNNGKFVLFDRDSTNGVFVNNRKISKHRLEEGDIIEIGDVFLRFTQHPLDYQLAESTSMLKTKAPIH